MNCQINIFKRNDKYYYRHIVLPQGIGHTLFERIQAVIKYSKKLTEKEYAAPIVPYNLMKIYVRIIFTSAFPNVNIASK